VRLALDRLWHYEDGGLQAEQTAVGHMVHRGSQAAMVVILERNKTEGLEHAIRPLTHGLKDFGHAVHWARLRLKRKFDKSAVA